MLESNQKFMVIEEITVQRINKTDLEELQAQLTVSGFIKIMKTENKKTIQQQTNGGWQQTETRFNSATPCQDQGAGRVLDSTWPCVWPNLPSHKSPPCRQPLARRVDLAAFVHRVGVSRRDARGSLHAVRCESAGSRGRL